MVLAHSNNLASGSSNDHNATSSHQIRLGDTAKHLGWVRTPVRRKNFRRRKARNSGTSSIRGALHRLFVVASVIYYYTSPNRSTPIIICMEALMFTHVLQTAAALLHRARQKRIRWPAAESTPPIKQTSFLDVLQKIWNKLMHSYIGNPVTLQLNSLIPHNPPQDQIGQSNPKPDEPLDFFHSQLKLSRNFLMQCRPPPRGQPIISTAHNPRLHRTGRRRTFFTEDGSKLHFSHNNSPHKFKNSNKPAKQPAPPHRGAPGTTSVVNEESKPFDPPLSSLLGWGSRFRTLRRRYYRLWKRTARENILSVGLGNLSVKGGQPLNAVQRYAHQGKNIAKQFRDLVLKQAKFCTRKNPDRKPQATPPIGYGSNLKVGAQNVQGMAELLKHQAILQLRAEQSLDVLFLTETHAKSYYSFHSDGHLFVVNGNAKDKWSGVTAVLAPHILPYVKNIIQHSSRILQIIISARSGDVHLIGVYVPHDKSEVEVRKLPFWDRLTEVISVIPSPEPVYVLGDYNVRLQGRGKEEGEILGPHIYGKGYTHANSGEHSNRTLYTALLKNFAAVDVMTYKQADLKQQITYKDKFAPPKSWDQFIQDPLGWLQLWDKFQTLDMLEDDKLTVVSDVRSYLGAETLPNLSPAIPEVDPYRYQSLDRLVTLRKWLPTVRYVGSKLNTGFPSDHFLLMAKIKIKLGAKIQKVIKPPRLEYTASQRNITRFNRIFKQQLSADHGLDIPGPPPSREAVVQVYTDGSGSRGKCTSSTPAGWGFVRVTEGEVAHTARGPVTTDHTAAHYLGATVGSNNTGELTAWMEAALYEIGRGSLPRELVFCYDSQWAANMVTGKFKAKRNKALVAQAKLIYKYLQRHTKITWRWVKGHSGEEYNEEADALAEAGKRDGSYVGGRHTAEHFYTPATLPQESTPPRFRTDTLEEHAQQFTDALTQAEKTTFKRMSVVPKMPWITPQLAEEIEQIKQRRRSGDPEAEQAYKQVKSKARKRKRDWTRQTLEDAGRNSTTVLWRATRRLKKGFRERKTRLKRNGRPVPWTQNHQVIADHLSQVQWAPSQVTEDEIKTLRDSPALHASQTDDPPPFTMEELDTVLATLRKNKAPGPDDIRSELILFLDNWGQDELLTLLNRSLTEKQVPQGWKNAFIISIYKGKGDDSDPANYRPISLLSTFYKIFAALIQKRLALAHDAQLRPTQYGFRSSRSTKDPLFILRRAQDLSLKTGTPICLLFLDWKMAFDKVDHRSMLIALERLGVHRHYVELIQHLYEDQTFVVKGYNGEETKATPHTGIRQGCPLSPYLFIMVMTVLLHDVDLRLLSMGVPTNTWSVGKPIYDLEYADDTLLLSVTPPQLEEFLKTVQVEASLYGMELNLDKTELLEGLEATPPIYFVNGTRVSEAAQAKYLGSQVSWTKPTKTAIDARKALAHSSYMKLQPLWRSKLNWKTKVRIFHSSVVPSLTYGLDTLTLEVRHLKTIDAWYYQHLRRCMGIKASYYSHVPNARVWKLAGRPIVPSQTLTSNQLRQLSECLTKPPTDPIHHVVFSPGCKDRVKFTKGLRRGHPQRYWLELNMEIALPILKAYAEYTAQEFRNDAIGLKQMLTRDIGFETYLVTAPTRQKGLFARHAKHLGSAWQP